MQTFVDFYFTSSYFDSTLKHNPHCHGLKHKATDQAAVWYVVSEKKLVISVILCEKLQWKQGFRINFASNFLLSFIFTDVWTVFCFTCRSLIQVMGQRGLSTHRRVGLITCSSSLHAKVSFRKILNQKLVPSGALSLSVCTCACVCVCVCVSCELNAILKIDHKNTIIGCQWREHNTAFQEELHFIIPCKSFSSFPTKHQQLLTIMALRILRAAKYRWLLILRNNHSCNSFKMSVIYIPDTEYFLCGIWFWYKQDRPWPIWRPRQDFRWRPRGHVK